MRDLINANVLELTPYTPGTPIEKIFQENNLKKVVQLGSNENPLGAPPHVVEAIQKEITKFNCYPENDCFYLKECIAGYNDVHSENVIVGSGSVEIIRLILRTFLKPDQTVLSSEKTFPIYKIFTISINGKNAYIEAPLKDDLSYDLNAIYNRIDKKTKIIFITNPNNPTGTMLKKEDVLNFIYKVPEDKIIVLDNAYQEYVNHPEDYPDCIHEATDKKNLIILRTFSKIYSLAGLRVGYGIADSELITYLNRVRTPFNITRPAQVAAMTSLENDYFKRESIGINLRNKERLYHQLLKMGIRVIPSETNFLLFFPGVDTRELNQRLIQEGVFIRPLHGFGIPDGMRVTVGLSEDNDYFVEKLKKVMDYMLAS